MSVPLISCRTSRCTRRAGNRPVGSGVEEEVGGWVGR